MEFSANVKKVWNSIAALLLVFYVFCGHLNYPFVSTYLLYASFFMVAVSLIFDSSIKISVNLIMFFIIILISLIGLIYTNDFSTGKRQVVFFAVYLIIFAHSLQNNEFLSLIAKYITIFAAIASISVFLQFIFTDSFNQFIKPFFRSDAYENVINAYEINKTFSGFTSSVSMASFSLAIVFFETLKKLIISSPKEDGGRGEVKRSKLSVVIFVIIALLALFGIILTSKRGIFLATILSFVLTLILDKEISLKKIKPLHFFSGVIFLTIIVIILYFMLENNEFVLDFLNRFKGDDITTGRSDIYSRAISDLSGKGALTYLFGNGTGSAVLINDTGLHNVYLQIFYDHGIFGIVFYLAFFIVNLKRAVNKKLFFSMSMQIVFLVYCMSGNPLYDYYFFIPYLIFVSMNK